MSILITRIGTFGSFKFVSVENHNLTKYYDTSWITQKSHIETKLEPSQLTRKQHGPTLNRKAVADERNAQNARKFQRGKFSKQIYFTKYAGHPESTACEAYVYFDDRALLLPSPRRAMKRRHLHMHNAPSRAQQAPGTDAASNSSRHSQPSPKPTPEPTPYYGCVCCLDTAVHGDNTEACGSSSLPPEDPDYCTFCCGYPASDINDDMGSPADCAEEAEKKLEIRNEQNLFT